MKRNWMLGFAVFALMLTGCKGLNDEQKSGLQLAAISAKERANAFDVIKDRFKPVKAENELPLKNFLAAHARGLNAQAAGLADLVEAAKSGSVISDRGRMALAEEAKSASSRARAWELVAPDISRDPALDEFIRSHTAALKSQADTLAQLSKLIPPKPPKPEPARASAK